MNQKTRIAALVCAIVALAAPLSAAASTCPALYRSLSRNAEGSDVRELQQFLADWGVLERAFVIGIFGLKTERAVQAFQVQQGIVSVGTPATTGFGGVGGKTRARIAAVCASGPSQNGGNSQQTSRPSSVNIVIPTGTMPVQTGPIVTAKTAKAPTIELGTVAVDKVMVNFYGIPPLSIMFMIDPVTGKRVEMGGYSPLDIGGSGYVTYPMLGEFAGNTYAFVIQASSTKQSWATSTSFTVPKPTAQDEVGVFTLYDGQVLIYSTTNVTKSSATARCKSEKSSYPARNTQCTFNGYTIFVQ
jgi:peptidoglycan hydrolase-like protein with peptidoglycan-binding domain